jgi:hypothetical protein
MAEKESTPHKAGEVALEGEAAKAAWREVRSTVAVAVAGSIVVLLLSGLAWHRTEKQMEWIGLGCGAFILAALVWKHNILGFSYQTTSESGGQVTRSFASKPSPVPRGLAVPALVLAGLVLVVAGTGSGVGTWLSSTFAAVENAKETATGLTGIIGLPIGALVLVVFVVAGLGLFFSGAYQFVKFAVGGFRRTSAEDSGLVEVFMGVVLLGFCGLMIYEVVANWSYVLGQVLGPYRAIGRWFA